MGELAIQQKGIMQMRLEKASKLDIIRSFSKLTLAKVVEQGYPSMVALKKVHGIDKVEKITAMILADLSHSFNNDLEQEHIYEVAIEISNSELKNMSIEDVFLACQQIKRKKNFGKLNVNKLMNALTEHFDNRCEVFMQHQIKTDSKKIGFVGGARTTENKLQEIAKNKEAHIKHVKQQAK